MEAVGENSPQRFDWRLDRRLSLSALAAGAGSLVTAAALIAGLATRVEHLESRAGGLEAEVRGVRSIAVGVARLEERLEALHRTLEELRGDMRLLSHGTARSVPVRISAKEIWNAAREGKGTFFTRTVRACGGTFGKQGGKNAPEAAPQHGEEGL